MKTALEAQIWNEKRWNDKTPAIDNKVEGRVVYEPTRGIINHITLTITATTVSEAIKLYRMGYISQETLLEVGVTIPALTNDARKTEIQNAITQHFSFTVEQLAVKCRKRSLVMPRQLSFYLLCRNTKFSLSEIGEMYGGRDHTTVMYGRDKIVAFLSAKGHSEEKDIINDFLSKTTFEG